jgi:Lrp/AsnC family leucine-responsive transcriptional regulator
MPINRRQAARAAFGIPHPELDEINLRLLTELIADPRLPMSALARRVNMSAPAVSERVRRMREARILTGYRVDIDPASLGLPVAAYVRIRPGPGQLPKLMQHTAGHQQVSECHRITGEDCLLVKVHAPTIQQLEAVLDSFLLYGQTTTSIVVSSPVPPRQLPIPEIPGKT